MKKILWVCNVPIPKISLHMGEKPSFSGGWLTGFANGLSGHKDIELNICFPILGGKNIVEGTVDGINYFGFPVSKRLGFLPIPQTTKMSLNLMDTFRIIISKVQPDIVHIFGTEFPHALAAAKVFNCPEKTVVNIQGLTSVIAKHYLANLPHNIIRKRSISDLFRGSIAQQANVMKKRGSIEIQTLNSVKHVIGRTDWDRACSTQINPKLQYHFCNEILRDCFYEHAWSLIDCQRYSIFISQARKPLKGLHFMLEAMPQILKEYPAAKLYVAGNDPTKNKSLSDKLEISSYGIYLAQLIKKYNLKNHIVFTGGLNEEQMCHQFLKANVFVSPSSIENSPNSVGEAMLLGTPTISSDVGGVKNLMNHKHDGIIYQHDAPYMLAYYVCEIFGNDELAKRLSDNARQSASLLYDKSVNTNKLIETYDFILK